MSEGLYRGIVVVLLTIFVAGSLFIGWRLSENGRFVQYDPQKEYYKFNDATFQTGRQLMDTRTGRVHEVEVYIDVRTGKEHEVNK
jgi:hypothetical protein